MLLGCGGATVAGPHARYAAIQVHEAELERALVRSEDGDCAGRRAELDAAGGASAAICELARGARDADAAVRCERATRRARDARASLDAACGA